MPAFVSCQKAAEMKESAEGAEGRLDVTGRVSDGGTKTVYTCEGHVLTPSWKVGDRIIGLWGEDRKVTYSVKSVDDEGVAKFKYVSGEEPWGNGEKVYVMYAPGRKASEVNGTGDGRTLDYDLSRQPGTLEGLGEVSLMGGSGIVSGTSLELDFSHLLSIVSIDTLKGLSPGKSYSIGIEGAGLANCGTFGISGGTVTFANGVDGRIGTGAAFTVSGEGKIGPAFFAVPAANLGDLTVSAVTGADTLKFTLTGKEVAAGNYYYKSVFAVRILSLSFAALEGAVPAGLEPEFKAGDVIKVSNGTESRNCTVAVDGGLATITTTLDGTLTAVYPSDAADMSGEEISGVRIPATQSGKFKDAVIALAEIGPEETEAEFSTEAMLRFYVEKGVKVKKITVTGSLVADGGNTITVDGGSGTLDGVTDDPGRRLCYVAVAKEVSAGSVTFVSETGTQGSVTGLPLSATGTLSAGTIYDAFIPYYIDLGVAGKWAYCNIGAFLPEECGDYFAWGEVKGHSPVGTGEDAFKDDFMSFDHSDLRYNSDSWNPLSGFDYCNTPFWLEGEASGAKFSKYKDHDEALSFEDDAAHVLWGGNWRMPRPTECDVLITGTTREWGEYKDRGVTGLLLKGLGEYSTNEVFLPAASDGSKLSFSDAGRGRYWSNSRFNYNVELFSYCLGFDSTRFECRSGTRFTGCPVRAVMVE